MVYANPSSSSAPQDFHTDLDEEGDENPTKGTKRPRRKQFQKYKQYREGKVGADKDRACVEYLRWDGDLEEIL